jgi:uncharacterized RmlC-like cupin family protein
LQDRRGTSDELTHLGDMLRHLAMAAVGTGAQSCSRRQRRRSWHSEAMSGELPRPVKVFTPADLAVADPTSGMHRALAFELPLLWSGQVETEPGAVSGWHHHERNDTSLYIVRGVLRLEFEGFDGYVDAGPGDFVHVPPWTVHRESNPALEPSLAVIARVGGGIPTVNVVGPRGPHD